MAYVPVPKDLTKVKTKVAFNLTKRQLVCFGGGALIGVPLFFLLRGPVGNSVAAMCMMLVMLPFFMLAMYEKTRSAPGNRSWAISSRWPSSGPRSARIRPTTSMPFWNGRKNSTRRCMTLFTVIKSWLHRLFGKRRKRPAQPVNQKKMKKAVPRRQKADRGCHCPCQSHRQKEKIGSGQYPL